MAWAATHEFPHPIINLPKNLFSGSKFFDRQPNSLSHTAVHELTWVGCSDLVNDCRHCADLPYATAASFTRVHSQYADDPH